MKEVYRWQNLYTGAIYRTLAETILASFSDMIHYPLCRTWEIFKIGRLEEE